MARLIDSHHSSLLCITSYLTAFTLYLFVQKTNEKNQQVTHFRKRAYEDIQWDAVFEGSIVKCEKCLDFIRTSVVREHVDVKIRLPKRIAPRFAFAEEATRWSHKIGVAAKTLANDPLWCCDHRLDADETYFVDAIQRGVSLALSNS